MPPAQRNILTVLLEDKKITPAQAEKLRLEYLSTSKSPEKVLIEKNLLPREVVYSAKAKELNVPFVTLANKAVSQDLLRFVPEQVARRYKVVPFDYDLNTNLLKLAFVDPLDFQALEFLEKKTGKKVQAYLCDPLEIEQKIEENYAGGLAAEVKEALKSTGYGTVKTVVAEKIGELIREAPIAKIVSTILEFAVRGRASDVHIEPQEQHTRVRYRIDGVLHEKLILPKNVQEALISRIKILSDMKIDEKRIPQDGRFNFKLGDEEVDLRVSTLPTVFGEKVVMRLLKKTGGIPDLPELGLGGLALKNLEEAMHKAFGIILVTGPTGSGKTTTLYSVLSRLNTSKVNIVTLEDPVEYQIAGLNQVQINPAAKLTFASGLRSFLRQDPNIILVGEIRDSETTALAIQAALTGHLVFSTLHTNNAATAIPRLLDMKAEPFLVASVLTIVEAQRICRKVCNTCKQEYTPDTATLDDMKRVLGNLYPQNRPAVFYHGKGCSDCSNTGFYGRIGIYEILKVSEKIAKMVIDHKSASDIENQAIEEGMVTMKQDGYLKVINGITTIEEVLRVSEA